MPKSLKLYVGGLVTASAFALVVTSLWFAQQPGTVLGMRPEISIIAGSDAPAAVFVGLLFWITLTLFASAMPVRMPRGTIVSVSMAPIIAAMALGGPVAAGWVAALGTTEVRELRGRVPWYGTLFNHSGIALPALVGGLVAQAIETTSPEPFVGFVATMAGAVTYFALNVTNTSIGVSLREGLDFRAILSGDARSYQATLLALAPLGWLMSRIYQLPEGGWWATLLFALPLYTTRLAHHRFMEMREMFTQTIGALAEAVDKRDPFTSQHSRRVKTIAVDIGRQMRVSEAELEALEWGGLLHDVGKIGVPDAVLLKQDRLTREERMMMNSHPVKGAEIIAQVGKLAPELPIIRHHHEWFNGSGYPDRLIGDEIPKLARILHVADAFEAMTAARPYRMTPLTAEQALAELRKFAGVQFDPEVVDAFVKTGWIANFVPGAIPGGGVPQEHPTAPGAPVPLRPRPVPYLGEAAPLPRSGDPQAPAATS
jgi:putative nucleotidyltransferase with HDIG domain